MPPKKAAAAAATAAPASQPKKSKKQADDAEFDALIKQLAKSTAAKGREEAKEAKSQGPHLTAAERKAAHRDRAAAEAKAKEDAVAKSIEQRSQQRKLQEMIREMMARGGMGMGQSPFLDAPVTTIETEHATAKAPSVINAGSAAMQGWRRNMEDAHIMYPNFRKSSTKGEEDWHLFAVMDGHGGAAVAHTTKILLPAILHRELEKAEGGKPTDAALTKAFLETDAAIKKKHGAEANSCGCTCVTVMIGATEVVCASVGDSRAVLARKAGTPNDVVTLSYDHKPENAAERARIEAGNGTVENNRVNGNLAMSRAIGDFMYKTVSGKDELGQLVIALPEVHRCPRVDGDEFVVVACDGIFDVLTNEELVSVIRAEITKVNPDGGRLTTQQLETVSGNVTKFCLAPMNGEGSGPARGEGSDNMSVIIVQL